MLVTEVLNIERELSISLIEMGVEIAKEPLFKRCLQLFEIETGVEILCELLAYRIRNAIRPENIGELFATDRLVEEFVLLNYRKAHVDELLPFLIAVGVRGFYVHCGEFAETRLDPLVIE